MLSKEDQRLLDVFSIDSRLTLEDLSIQTGLPPAYIEKRLKQWEQEKIIVNYRPTINRERLGEPLVAALIDVKVLPQRGYGFDQLAKRLQKYPEIKSVYLMSGSYDLSLLIEGKTMHDVALFVAEKLAPLEHVQATTTHFLLRRYKENGEELLGTDEGAERLVVSP